MSSSISKPKTLFDSLEAIVMEKIRNGAFRKRGGRKSPYIYLSKRDSLPNGHILKSLNIVIYASSLEEVIVKIYDRFKITDVLKEPLEKFIDENDLISVSDLDLHQAVNLIIDSLYPNKTFGDTRYNKYLRKENFLSNQIMIAVSDPN